MRWESLFADLEAQLEEEASAELAAEVADRTRREVARLRVVDRLRGAVGQTITAYAQGAPQLYGRLEAVGADWFLLADERGREVLVPIAPIVGISGLTPWSTEPGSEGKVASRLDLGHALRGLARDRVAVEAFLVDGTRVTGTVDRVGSDFLELAEHELDEPRRAASVRGMRLIPTAAIGCLRGLTRSTVTPWQPEST